jgi:hypothetical protein
VAEGEAPPHPHGVRMRPATLFVCLKMGRHWRPAVCRYLWDELSPLPLLNSNPAGHDPVEVLP